MRRYFGIVIFLSSLLVLLPAYADSIILANGKTIEGKIVEKTDKYVKVEADGVTLTYYLDEIKNFNQNSNSSKEKTAQDILENVKSAYNSLRTYKTKGKGSMTMDTSGQKILKEIDFSMILKKPNMYLISWTEKDPITLVNSMSSAVWNNGEQSYQYQSQLQNYMKMPNDFMALTMASGLSFEASRVIPLLFFYASDEQSPLKSWTNLSRGADEKVNGVDCYVISGSSLISQNETIWVSKENYYILKSNRSLAPPTGGFKILEESDKKLNERLKSMGMVMTDEQKKVMRDQMRRMMEKMKNIKISGTLTQNYSEISTPTLNNQDFQFTVPNGIELRKTFPTQDTMMSDLQRKTGNEAITKLNQANTQEQRFCTLGGAAKAYLNQGNKIQAKQLADELLVLIPKYPRHWNYGNAIQDANIVLGRIAVADGKIDDAKKYLLEAANSSGSPQMNSFGPNMTLAKDLLKKGQKDAVLQYFELCGKFWKMDFGKLKEWTEDIKNGRAPDFGGNLLY